MANWLTNIGKQIVTARLLSPLPGSGIGSAAPIHIAWGNGAGTTAVGDTTLFVEQPEARVAGTATQMTTTGGTTNDTYQVQGTIIAIADKTITNAGLFDTAKAESAAIAGNLFAKGDFGGVPLVTGDSISFTFRWQLQ